MRHRRNKFILWTLLVSSLAPLPVMAVEADAGPDQDVLEQTLVQLDGSRSRPEDGGTLVFSWKQTQGPSVQLSDPASANPTFTSPEVAGNGNGDGNRHRLEFRLTVREVGGRRGDDDDDEDDDDDGRRDRVDEDQVGVNVANAGAGGDLPIANAGEDRDANPGEQVLLDGRETFDPGVGRLRFIWRQVAGPTVELRQENEKIARFTAPDVTSTTKYTFELLVTNGTNSSTDTVDAFVHPPVTAGPSADAGPDQTVVSGDAVTLDGRASGGQAFSWTQVSGPPVELRRDDPASPVATFTAPRVDAPAELLFRITSTAASGSASDDVAVTVLPPDGNRPPVAEAGDDATVPPGETVELDGSGSADPDDEPVATWLWEQIGGPEVVVFNADQAVASFVAPQVPTATEFQFRLTVGNASGSSSDVMTVVVAPNVQAAPTPRGTAGISELSLYPNPFDPGAGPANIEFVSGADGEVKITIYDLFGAEVREFGAPAVLGRTTVQWDGRNGKGDTVGNGGYVVQIEASDAQGNTVRETDRLAVVK